MHFFLKMRELELRKLEGFPSRPKDRVEDSWDQRYKISILKNEKKGFEKSEDGKKSFEKLEIRKRKKGFCKMKNETKGFEKQK